MDPDPIDTVADELYALPPEEFTAARSVAEKGARSTGDRDLATRIKALAKPNVVGWLVNQLVRERPQDLQPFLELGEELRAAATAGEGERLRALGQVQRQTVAALLDDALAIASRSDRAVSADVRRTLTETLRAALADADAASALQQGRLTTGLYSSGLGGTVSAGATTPSARPARTAPSTLDSAAPTPPDDGTTPAEHRAEQRRRAHALVDDARELAAAATDADDAAQQAVSTATAEVERLRSELETAAAAAVRAERDRSQAAADLTRAMRAVELAERRAARISP